MNLKLIQLGICITLGILALPSIGQQPSLGELEQQCEVAREEQIAPLRQAAIEECIEHRANNRGSGDARAHCEGFYSDFGSAGRTQTGGFRQRMFHDIPECQQFYEAEQAARRR